MIPYITHFWGMGVFILLAIGWNDDFQGICICNFAIGKVSDRIADIEEKDAVEELDNEDR
jgi:hypothetical protein